MYARRRARPSEVVGDMGGGGFGSSEMTADNNLPPIERTGLRAEDQPCSVDPLPLRGWVLTKLSIRDSMSLLEVERRADREHQKISGVSPLDFAEIEEYFVSKELHTFPIAHDRLQIPGRK